MDYIEITGATINEAVDKGKDIMGLGYDEIEYDVIEEPRKGFLGIGTKPAKVIVKRTGVDVAKLKAEEAAKLEKEEREKQAKKEAELAAQKAKEAAEQAKIEKQQAAAKAAEAKMITAVTTEKTEKAVPQQTEVQTAEESSPVNMDKAVADSSKFLSEVFNAMNLNVEIQKQEDSGRQLYLNLAGDDMGVIIGKRGQTLDSLQYLTNLVINKGSSPYISVHLDTKDYRKKRKETLENLAKNLAKKAKHIRRNVVLEPMSPYERRIIHSTLQNDRYVTTFSEGEEPYRHVVISPKYK